MGTAKKEQDLLKDLIKMLKDEGITYYKSRDNDKEIELKLPSVMPKMESGESLTTDDVKKAERDQNLKNLFFSA